MSLREAIGVFVRTHTAKALGIVLAMNILVRWYLGPFTLWDALVVLTVSVLYPLVEWCIHRYILHWVPLPVGKRTLDFRVAKKHRAHHTDPSNTEILLLPLPSAICAYLAILLVAWLILPTVALCGTLMTVVVWRTLLYEWVHFLCHTSYRPRGWYYKRLWRNHRLHHFKNEKYWMGVVTLAGDRLLGTLPDKRDVGTSPTRYTII